MPDFLEKLHNAALRAKNLEVGIYDYAGVIKSSDRQSSQERLSGEKPHTGGSGQIYAWGRRSPDTFVCVIVGTSSTLEPSGQPFCTLCSKNEVAAYIRWYSLLFPRWRKTQWGFWLQHYWFESRAPRQTVVLLRQVVSFTFFLPLLLIFLVRSSQNDGRCVFAKAPSPCKPLCSTALDLRSHFIMSLVQCLRMPVPSVSHEEPRLRISLLLSRVRCSSRFQHENLLLF